MGSPPFQAADTVRRSRGWWSDTGLLKEGALLSVTFTWTDPTVFRTPHSYEYRYHRLPATYEPRQWLPCDPYDEDRTKFLEPPRIATPAGRALPKE